MSDEQSLASVKSTFGEIVKKLVNGGTPPTESERFWNGKIPWITGADFTSGGLSEFRRFVSENAIAQTATNLIHEGQLLVVTRTGVGKLAIAPCDVAISQDITGVYPDTTKVDVQFLYHRMRRGVEDLKRLHQGTSINGIIRSDLVTYPIDLPPLRQQRRIAEILSTLDEAIEQTGALIAKYLQIKAGLMHDLFTRGITPDGRLRPTRDQAPYLYKESTLGWIPIEWSVAPLVSFATSRPGAFVNGPFGSHLLTSELRDSGVAVIYVQDVKEDEYRRVSNAHLTEEKANQLVVCNVTFGDVLVAKVGDPPGIAAVYAEKERAVITQDVIRIRPAGDVVGQFLSGLLNSTVGSRAIRRIIIEGTRSRVSLTEFKTVLLPKPAREEQELIAERLSAIRGLIHAATIELAKLKAKRHGLPHDLLIGRVRVEVPEVAAA